MTRQSAIARKAEEMLGAAVVATAPVAGGDINTTTRLKLSDGRSIAMKTHPHAPPGFFPAEARGLSWLGEVEDGLAVPDVLAVDEECLVLPWIEEGKPSGDAAASFGLALARLHQAGVPSYGAEHDGYIGRLPMPNGAHDGWPEFYATRRVLPYLQLARDRDAISPNDAAAVEGLLGRLGELVPDEPAVRLHGDLWNGNVLWGSDGTAHGIDPAAYGGHREVDLAMLALFGMPHLSRAMAVYEETAPLADGFEERVGVHQLFPLLVHACMFGGGYGARAGAVAASFS
jgi:fructosamine-3-kinase